MTYDIIMICHCLEGHPALEERPCHRMGFSVSVVAVSWITGMLRSNANMEYTRHLTLVRLAARSYGMIRHDVI